MPTIIPTKRCNLRCRHCMRSTFASDFLDINLYDKFIKDVLLTYGPPGDGWSYTGGEPTLHPEIGKLLATNGKYNTKASIMTNGQFMPGIEQVIKNKLHVSFIRLSIDGHNAEVNDVIRGEGSFDECITAIKEYVRNGVPIILGVTAHDDNIDTIEECILLGRSLAVGGVAIWCAQQWVEVASSDLRTKSLKKGEDITWTEETTKKLQTAQQGLIEKYKSYFRNGVTISGKFSNPGLNRNWVCENFSDDARAPRNIARRIVLLPDGLISACCDLYDVNYNPRKYDASPFCEEPVSDILGDFSKQDLDEILLYKRRHFTKLAARRVRDLDAGLLVNGRENLCTNCAYYHYQPSSKIIPIIAG